MPGNVSWVLRNIEDLGGLHGVWGLARPGVGLNEMKVAFFAYGDRRREDDSGSDVWGKH